MSLVPLRLPELRAVSDILEAKKRRHRAIQRLDRILEESTARGLRVLELKVSRSEYDALYWARICAPNSGGILVFENIPLRVVSD